MKAAEAKKKADLAIAARSMVDVFAAISQAADMGHYCCDVSPSRLDNDKVDVLKAHGYKVTAYLDGEDADDIVDYYRVEWR